MACAAAALLTACSAKAIPPSSPALSTPPSPHTITLTKKADGTTVDATIGDRIEIDLRQAHDCPGYAWVEGDPWDPAEAPDQHVVAYQTTDAKVLSPDGTKMIPSGRDILIYEAASEGTKDLELQYIDPDKPENYAHDDVTFSVKFNISSPAPVSATQ